MIFNNLFKTEKNILRFSIICLLFFILVSTSYSQTLSKEIVDKVKEATVYIEIKKRLTLNQEEAGFSGSGFLISPHGYIVTNYHVVSSSFSAYSIPFPAPVTDITVTLNSGTADYKRFKAKIVAVDKENDLALLYINIDGLNDFTFLNIDERDIKPFEASPSWVFGFPFGDAFSVIQRGPEITITKGYITALRHDDRNILENIQVDVNVNPGNSGGPLINENGKVIGVIYKAGGTTGMNFAVPVHFLHKLKEEIPTNLPLTDTVTININSTPDNAYVFIDLEEVGITPIQDLKLASGWKTICVKKEGYESWIKELSIIKNDTVDANLVPVAEIPLEYFADDKEKHTEKLDANTLQKIYGQIINIPDKIIMQTDFNNPEVFETWEQSTGGTARRTWFIENNLIHQNDTDGLLHAIYIGESDRKNYMVSTRVKITETPADGRAGIIFRENENGFYLFRIHKETKKAQLAYHSKSPFGWFVLNEKKIETEILNEWHKLSVLAYDNVIACFMDTVCIFISEAMYSNAGRIGLYSVECKASFDSLNVFKIPEDKRLDLSAPDKLKYLSFWFSDYFDNNSTWWYQYVEDENKPEPWHIGDLGGFGLDKLSENRKTNEFTRYTADNFYMSLAVTFDKAVEDSYFDIYFRKTGNYSLILRFLKNKNQLYLIETNNNRKRTLKRSKLPPDFFNNIHVIQLVINENEITCQASDTKLMEYKSRKLPVYGGKFGFSTKQLRVVFHQLNIGSVK